MDLSLLSKYNGVYVHDASTRKVWGDSFIFVTVHKSGSSQKFVPVVETPKQKVGVREEDGL